MALSTMHVWKESNFQGECPPIRWKRSKKLFWSIVNAREENSRKKIMRSYYSVKLHPCKYCTEFEEEIEIFEMLVKAHADEQDVDLKAEKQRRLDQWSLKIAALRRHADKHSKQRAAVQQWKKDCKDFPGTCLVYEDFCNMYEANSAKMLNLVMVLVYWDAQKNECVQEYHDTFYRGSVTLEESGDLTLRGSQDNHVYRECWLAAFEENFFEKFHTIYKTGDNGSALKSYDTFYLHSVLMALHFVRIVYFTLCPYHAENYCDPAGARTKTAIKLYERKIGAATGDAESTAAARNSVPRKNLKKAKAVEAIREYSEYKPEAMIRKKQDHWPYSLGQCCVAFLQMTDIHENSEDPERTIELGACGFGAPTTDDPFGVIDLRIDSLDAKKICLDCSKRFQRGVPVEEHNQKGFFLCPIAKVYRRETKESLNRDCPHCNKKVKDAHTESSHKTNECPSKIPPDAKGQGRRRRSVILHRHKTFLVQSISGWQRYSIIFHKKDFKATDVTPKLLAQIKSRFKPVNKDVAKITNASKNSLNAARMMAPGITVVYPIDAKDQAKRQCALPWGIGVCDLVDKQTKTIAQCFYAHCSGCA